MKVIRGLFMVVAAAVAIWALFLRGNPGGISDARYAQFKSADPPKVLYSCTRTPMRAAFITQEKDCLKTGRSSCDVLIGDLVKAGTKINVDFVSGAGMSTYDQLLMEARQACNKSVGSMEAIEFRILAAAK